MIQSKDIPKAATSAPPVAPGGKAQPTDKEPGIPFDISSYFAQELETSGRMKPVVWSLGDPVFRQANTSRLVTYENDFPTLAEATAAAGKLKLEYVAVVAGRLKEGMLHASFVLYKGSRKVFDREDSVGASVSGSFDIEGSVSSICRTWTQLLSEGLLKGQPVAPLNPTPDESPGQVPVTTPVAPPKKVVNNQTLLAEASELMRQGKLSEAIALLRDAVDSAPMDVERRTVLATLLMRAGQPEMAALAARRAADLIQDSAALRAMAARAWMAAGKPEEAQADLKEAIARDPDNADTRTLLAEIALKEGKAAVAVDHLTHAISKADSKDLHFRLAVSHGGLGNLESVREELSKAGKSGDEVELRGRFDLTAGLLDGWAKTEGGNLVSLFQRALVRRTDPAVAEQVVRNKKLLDAYLALGSGLEVPAAHRGSHDRRLVALRLMVQCVGDLAAYLTSGSEDLITEGRINLGEAVRNLNAAIAAYATERGQG